MPLATILGVFLWLLSPAPGVVLSGHVNTGWQDAQPPSSPPGAPPQQSSPAATSSTDPQKSSAKPAAVAPPCVSNPQPSSPPGATAKPDCPPQKSSSTGAKKPHRPRKPAPPTTTDSTKTVIRNGSTSEPEVDLSPNVSEKQASDQVAETKKRLAAADANLEKIAGRQLSATQQDTVKQIKNYMEQSEAAKADGDFERAYNLAVKANLLSAELAAH